MAEGDARLQVAGAWGAPQPGGLSADGQQHHQSPIAVALDPPSSRSLPRKTTRRLPRKQAPYDFPQKEIATHLLGQPPSDFLLREILTGLLRRALGDSELGGGWRECQE